MNTFCDQHYIFETAKTGVEKWLNLSQGAVRHIPAKREMLDMRQRAKLFGKIGMVQKGKGKRESTFTIE